MYETYRCVPRACTLRQTFFFMRYFQSSWLSRKYHSPPANVDRMPPSLHGIASGGTLEREREGGREWRRAQGTVCDWPVSMKRTEAWQRERGKERVSERAKE